MIPKPNWIQGGDPIRFHRKDAPSNFTPNNLKWQTQTSWTNGEGTLGLELGFQQSGEFIAYRIEGEIVGTARHLHGEIGWVISPDNEEEFEVSQIDPTQWSEEWKRYLYGKQTDTELAENLSSSENQARLIIPSPIQPENSRRVLLAMAVGAAALLGFLLGALVFNRDNRQAEPPPTSNVKVEASSAQIPTLPEPAIGQPINFENELRSASKNLSTEEEVKAK